MLRTGLGCRIGNGSTIRVLEDPWLPSEHEAHIQTSNPAIQGQMVSCLLDENGDWDGDLIRDIFDSRDVNVILSISLNAESQNTWYWRREKMGNYSVKSAYTLLQELNTDQNIPSNSGFWRRLWNLKIPPKVKHFLWRAVTNCLPT